MNCKQIKGKLCNMLFKCVNICNVCPAEMHVHFQFSIFTGIYS